MIEWNLKSRLKKKEIVDGKIILINKFNVEPNKVEQFVKDWGKDATKFKQQPGFISVQLHKGIDKSSVFIVYAVWESIEHYKEAVNKLVPSSESQPRLLKYDDNSLVMSPHLFKIAVPEICGDWYIWRAHNFSYSILFLIINLIFHIPDSFSLFFCIVYIFHMLRLSFFV